MTYPRPIQFFYYQADLFWTVPLNTIKIPIIGCCDMYVRWNAFPKPYVNVLKEVFKSYILYVRKVLYIAYLLSAILIIFLRLHLDMCDSKKYIYIFLPFIVNLFSYKKHQTVRRGAMSQCHLSIWPGIIKLFPATESFVSDILAGDGKTANLFYSAWVPAKTFFYFAKC